MRCTAILRPQLLCKRDLWQPVPVPVKCRSGYQYAVPRCLGSKALQEAVQVKAYAPCKLHLVTCSQHSHHGR